MSSVIVSNRTSKMLLLQDFCLLSDESDFIEIVNWVNGEGFDVEIYTKNETQRFSMTYGQLQALNKLANHESRKDYK